MVFPPNVISKVVLALAGADKPVRAASVKDATEATAISFLACSYLV
jgi:hypothetical protein